MGRQPARVDAHENDDLPWNGPIICQARSSGLERPAAAHARRLTSEELLQIGWSADGEWIYVGQWGAHTFSRMRLRGGARDRETIKLDFRPDNVHWSPDGMLLLAGHTDTGSNVVKIDPRTLRVTELITRPDAEVFRHASAAVQVKDEIWLGTSRGERIAIYPLPPTK